MKKLLLILMSIFFVSSCATMGDRTVSLELKIVQLQDRVEQLEMMQGVGVGADIYPVTQGFTGGGTGVLDTITSTEDDDASMVIFNDDTTYGEAVFFYSLDSDGGSGDDVPWYVESGDGSSERWELCDGHFNSIFSKIKVQKKDGASYQPLARETGTMFINDDNDIITFGTLPADPTDLVYCFGNDTGVTAIITITPDASDYIVLDGTATSQAEGIKSGGNAKDSVCLIGLDSSYWKVTGYVGTWTEVTP